MLKNEGEAMAVCPSEVTQTPEQVRVFKANDPSSSFSSGLKRCVVKPLISSSSPVVGKYTPENSSLDEKRVLGESDLGFCKTQRDAKNINTLKEIDDRGR